MFLFMMLLILLCAVGVAATASVFAPGIEVTMIITAALLSVILYGFSFVLWRIFIASSRWFGGDELAGSLLFLVSPLLPTLMFLGFFGKRYWGWGEQ